MDFTSDLQVLYLHHYVCSFSQIVQAIVEGYFLVVIPLFMHPWIISAILGTACIGYPPCPQFFFWVTASQNIFLHPLSVMYISGFRALHLDVLKCMFPCDPDCLVEQTCYLPAIFMLPENFINDFIAFYIWQQKYWVKMGQWNNLVALHQKYPK